MEASKDLDQVQNRTQKFKNSREMRSELIGRCASALQRTNFGAILEEEEGGERIELGDKVGVAGQTETNFAASAGQKDKDPRL